jgi:hypothetical protein
LEKTTPIVLRQHLTAAVCQMGEVDARAASHHRSSPECGQSSQAEGSHMYEGQDAILPLTAC